MHRDIYNNVKNVVGLKLQTIASDTATAGEIVDTAGFESGMVSLVTGTVTAGNIIITKVQESADSGMAGATDIPANRIIGTATAITASDTVDEIGFVAALRYVQATYTTADTANLVVGSVVALGNPHNASIR